jgi:hypothetical protein
VNGQQRSFGQLLRQRDADTRGGHAVSDAPPRIRSGNIRRQYETPLEYATARGAAHFDSTGPFFCKRILHGDLAAKP